MKEIKLTKGKVAIVDDEDYGWLNKWHWQAHSCGYAIRNISKDGKTIAILMHRLIINPPPGMWTDHINRNKLDNRRCNLRICTKQENQINKPNQINNKSGYKGISWYKPGNKWRAFINCNYKQIHLGYYYNLDEAIVARNKKEVELFGEFANAQ